MGPHANEILQYVCRKPLPFFMISLPRTLPPICNKELTTDKVILFFYTSTTHLKYVMI